MLVVDGDRRSRRHAISPFGPGIPRKNAFPPTVSPRVAAAVKLPQQQQNHHHRHHHHHHHRPPDLFVGLSPRRIPSQQAAPRRLPPQRSPPRPAPRNVAPTLPHSADPAASAEGGGPSRQSRRASTRAPLLPPTTSPLPPCGVAKPSHAGYVVLVSPDEALASNAGPNKREAAEEEACSWPGASSSSSPPWFLAGRSAVAGVEDGLAFCSSGGDHCAWEPRARDQGHDDTFWTVVGASDPATFHSWPSNGLPVPLLAAEPLLLLSPGSTGSLPMDGAFYFENELCRRHSGRSREATAVDQEEEAFRLDVRDDDLFEMDGGALGVEVGCVYKSRGIAEIAGAQPSRQKRPKDSADLAKPAAPLDPADESQAKSRPTGDECNPFATSVVEFASTSSIVGIPAHHVQHFDQYLHGRLRPPARSAAPQQPRNQQLSTSTAETAADVPSVAPSRPPTCGIRLVLLSKHVNDGGDSSVPTAVLTASTSQQRGKENPPVEAATLGSRRNKPMAGRRGAGRRSPAAGEDADKRKFGSAVAAAEPGLKRPRGRPPKNTPAGAAGAASEADNPVGTRFSTRIARK